MRLAIKKWLVYCKYDDKVYCFCCKLFKSSTSNNLSLLQVGMAKSWSLLLHIRRLLDMNWEVRICHSYREANACADTLANIACDGGFTLMLYEHCPAQISMVFLAGLTGVCTPRIVRR